MCPLENSLILEKVLVYLELKSIGKLALTNKNCNSEIASLQAFWKRRFQARYPHQFSNPPFYYRIADCRTWYDKFRLERKIDRFFTGRLGKTITSISEGYQKGVKFGQTSGRVVLTVSEVVLATLLISYCSYFAAHLEGRLSNNPHPHEFYGRFVLSMLFISAIAGPSWHYVVSPMIDPISTSPTFHNAFGVLFAPPFALKKAIQSFARE